MREIPFEAQTCLGQLKMSKRTAEVQITADTADLQEEEEVQGTHAHKYS